MRRTAEQLGREIAAIRDRIARKRENHEGIAGDLVRVRLLREQQLRLELRARRRLS